MAINGRTVSIELPEPIFQRLQHIAEVTHRSVEDVLATTVDAALPQLPDIPADVANDLAAMAVYSDTALWSAAETKLSPEQQRRLSQLSEDGETRLLSDAEAEELGRLIDTYDRVVLRRAKALAILAQRGHNVSPRTGFPSSADERG